jgi:hypothetical protein
LLALFLYFILFNGCGPRAELEIDSINAAAI